ncbi:MAG: hypothetical protein LLG20_24960 [Acidobacteriales bacterium]|nr:hypothetical protein [Terriglobales bacterium]
MPAIRPSTVSRPEPVARARDRKDLWIALLVGLLCLLIYNANRRLIAAGDTYPARYLPFGIWHDHTLVLDPIATITAQGRKIGVPPGQKAPRDEWLSKAYWIVWSGNRAHVISLYPVTTPVLLAPLYAPAVYYLNVKGWDPWRLDQVARIMEKLSASLLAAASAALLYLLLRRRAEPRLALLLTLAYALGTTTWMISSQALWQHGMTELLVAGMLLTVTGPCTSRAVVTSGFLCGLIACNRPPDAILAGAIGVYGLWWAGRRAPLLAGAALAPVLLLTAYNFWIAGHWAGGYGLVGEREFFSYDPVSGALGLLFSPARGLFVYSPFLLFVPVFARRIWRDADNRFLSVAMGAAVLLQVAVYASTDWRQGVTWGPRWLTGALPMLVWMLPPVLTRLHRTGWTVFVAACLAGVAIEGIGAFWYTGTSDLAINAVPAGQEHATRAAWDPRNSPFVVELRHAAAPTELTTAVRGSLDIARTSDGEALSLASSRDLHVEGWALANGRTPREVAILLDGQAVASTHDFFVRPDVTKALGVPSASGWRIQLPARTIDPGNHLLAVQIRAVEGGEAFFLADREFTTVEDAETEERLSATARQAAASIAAHQQAPGYWLTAFTDAPGYIHPGREMNTFLNAVMADLLAPVAEEARLGGNMRRARRFLSAQIEEDGLVRYHGRPDSSVIGTLGCAITPDADDTSVVWRIAPAGDRGQLASALATLRRYRTPEGLYRTWLAPRDRYQCIDAGANPNPADIGIQMHVFMLLAKEDPPAARALCSALDRQIANDEIWVYYRTAPVVPILRQADLNNAGCKIKLPDAALTRIADGQQVWITAARLLKRFTTHGGALASHAEAASLLEQLSRDGFAPLRQSPPLLYHNDLTASVRRFYWSEDLGYALWLRLYWENKRAYAPGSAAPWR